MSEQGLLFQKVLTQPGLTVSRSIVCQHVRIYILGSTYLLRSILSQRVKLLHRCLNPRTRRPCWFVIPWPRLATVCRLSLRRGPGAPKSEMRSLCRSLAHPRGLIGMNASSAWCAGPTTLPSETQLPAPSKSSSLSTAILCPT